MDFSEETSLGNYLSRCLLEIDEWIILTLFFMSVMDTLVQQIRLIALVLKPNALHPRTVQGELLCLFPKIITQIVDYLFETLNLLVPFPCHDFLSLLLFASSRWKSCFRALSGKPTQNVHGNSSFGWVDLKIILFFLISGIFGFSHETSYISGRREYITIVEKTVVSTDKPFLQSCMLSQ